MKNEVIYSVIVPLYNEELVIRESHRRLTEVMESTEEEYEIIFVNDGSKDRTKDIVEDLCEKDSYIKLVNFSRNFGHQPAITAGMEVAVGKAVIVIDADLQDPPEVMLDMIKKWKEGYDVVYGKRAKREGETFFKKFTAKSYYRLLKSMTTVEIPVDTGDFRLIDRRVCDALNSLPEKNRFVRGLVSWLGFKQTSVEFVRQERFAGETKYPLKKMLKLAFDGITSFSFKPLMIANYLGALALFLGVILFIGNIINDLIKNINILNISFILAINLIMFGFIFICIGVMGQYIGRIFDESKNRPLYVIDNIVNKKEVEKPYEVRN
ncbi:glycosyltransferase family 2 protein [Clostridium sp. SHJSY1]|uniref:glycosyltransferase family 2 protein n=1 Tax=Clostridium sp. SHJSY1 TaxID=2942483 RepID=UPI002875F974|nr:glycosyltransferase family 2 protein [Clostridium sp. SHJSY1]MDS0526127.1 glycosyltransferase family 2 protein [Clostridium sp. SHJSY1]